MNFQHEKNQRFHSYYLEREGERLAEVVYSAKDDNTLVIEHTQVDEQLKGQHVGEALVERVVEEARGTGKKIVPVCTFANALFKRKPDWADVRA